MVGWANRCSGRIQIQYRSGRPTVFLATHNKNLICGCIVWGQLACGKNWKKHLIIWCQLGVKGKSETATHMRRLGETNADTSLWVRKTPLSCSSYLLSSPSLSWNWSWELEPQPGAKGHQEWYRAMLWFNTQSCYSIESPRNRRNHSQNTKTHTCLTETPPKDKVQILLTSFYCLVYPVCQDLTSPTLFNSS